MSWNSRLAHEQTWAVEPGAPDPTEYIVLLRGWGRGWASRLRFDSHLDLPKSSAFLRRGLEPQILQLLITSINNQPSSTTAGSTITFTATATGGAEPYTYNWNLGGRQHNFRDQLRTRVYQGRKLHSRSDRHRQPGRGGQGGRHRQHRSRNKQPADQRRTLHFLQPLTISLYSLSVRDRAPLAEDF